MLKALGVFECACRYAAPLKAIRIIDVSRSLLPGARHRVHGERARSLAAFGYNIANTALVEALYARAQIKLRTIVPASVARIDLGWREGDGSIAPMARRSRPRLVVGADGRPLDLPRRLRGSTIDEWRYDQGAIATSFGMRAAMRASRSSSIARTRSLTTVPLPDPRGSSLIWVGETAEIDRADGARRRAASRDALAERLDGLLGQRRARSASARFFAVAGLTAKQPRRRAAPLSSARPGHILPPIGAQGLNLGLRDAARSRTASAVRLATPAIPAATRCCKPMPARGGSTC